MSQAEIDTGYYRGPLPTVPAGSPEPVWELATMWPAQGVWSEEDYLELTETTNGLAELTDGQLEVLTVPTMSHQLLVYWLCEKLVCFIRQGDLGIALAAPLRVRLREGMIREPDVVFMAAANRGRANDSFWEGADLVMEVVSPDEKSRHRDYVKKRTEYAQANIPEYWIVDPLEEKITVLTLPQSAQSYTEHGVFKAGETASSKLLAGFEVDVRATFDAAKK